MSKNNYIDPDKLFSLLQNFANGGAYGEDPSKLDNPFQNSGFDNQLPVDNSFGNTYGEQPKFGELGFGKPHLQGQSGSGQVGSGLSDIGMDNPFQNPGFDNQLPVDNNFGSTLDQYNNKFGVFDPAGDGVAASSKSGTIYDSDQSPSAKNELENNKKIGKDGSLQGGSLTEEEQKAKDLKYKDMMGLASLAGAGDVGLEGNLQSLGRGLAMKPGTKGKGAVIGLSAANATLKTGRNLLSGFSGQKVNNEFEKWQRDQMLKKQDESDSQYFDQNNTGGTVSGAKYGGEMGVSLERYFEGGSTGDPVKDAEIAAQKLRNEERGRGFHKINRDRFDAINAASGTSLAPEDSELGRLQRAYSQVKIGSEASSLDRDERYEHWAKQEKAKLGNFKPLVTPSFAEGGPVGENPERDTREANAIHSRFDPRYQKYEALKNRQKALSEYEKWHATVKKENPQTLDAYNKLHDSSDSLAFAKKYLPSVSNPKDVLWKNPSNSSNVIHKRLDQSPVNNPYDFQLNNTPWSGDEAGISQREGDDFRAFVNANFQDYAEKNDITPTGAPNDEWMKSAYYDLGQEYENSRNLSLPTRPLTRISTDNPQTLAEGPASTKRYDRATGKWVEGIGNRGGAEIEADRARWEWAQQNRDSQNRRVGLFDSGVQEQKYGGVFGYQDGGGVPSFNDLNKLKNFTNLYTEAQDDMDGIFSWDYRQTDPANSAAVRRYMMEDPRYNWKLAGDSDMGDPAIQAPPKGYSSWQDYATQNQAKLQSDVENNPAYKKEYGGVFGYEGGGQHQMPDGTMMEGETHEAEPESTDSYQPGQFVEFEYKGKMVSGKIKKIENGQIYI